MRLLAIQWFASPLCAVIASDVSREAIDCPECNVESTVDIYVEKHSPDMSVFDSEKFVRIRST